MIIGPNKISAKRSFIINKFEIRNSNINGKGIFATQKIARGHYITALTGEPLTTKEVALAVLASEISYDDPLQIEDNLHLVLNPVARAFNHSCSPNAGIRHSNHLYAFKDIAVDEEITYDYSSTVGMNIEWYMPCQCGTEACRKEIGNILTIPEILLKEYTAFDLLPDYIKKQLSKGG